MNISVPAGLNANVNGLRRPSAQIARFLPVAELKNGLSVGIVPSVLMRSILPSTLPIDCAFAPLAFSPTAAYSLPSGPKASAPPLWFVALLEIVELEDHDFAAGDGDVAVGGEAADAVVHRASWSV